MMTAQILAKVDTARLRKAVDGFCSGAYTVAVTGETEQEVRGYVTNGDGREYGCTLTEHGAFCSCPDAMYRRGVSKHAVVLALHAIRHPREGQAAEEWKPNLKLVKTRPAWVASA